MESTNTVHTREKWIDAAKLIGMFLIYIGHYGQNAGLAYKWVFSFHVALFFFISGMMENYNSRGIIKNLIHKTATIAVPYCLFGMVYAVYILISYSDPHFMKEYLILILKGGIRNSIELGAGLWFLSCLYIMSVAFSLIRLVKNKVLIMGISFGLYVISELFIYPRPAIEPHWIWNADSACYYIVYYSLGYILFDVFKSVADSKQRNIRIAAFAFFVLCFIYSGILFCGPDVLLGIAGKNVVLSFVHGILRSFLSIYVIMYISILVQNNYILSSIGTNSLYLCGNEALIKELVPITLAMLGLEKHTDTPIQVFIYCMVLIFLVNYIIVPIEKPLFERTKNLIDNRLFDEH